jgi:cyclohexanecarboxylate-CoA ligase
MEECFRSASTLEQRATWRRNGWWRDETIVDDLHRAIRAHPDRPAIIGAHPSSGKIEEISYAELGQYTDRFAGALRELGVGRGQPVAILLPNWWQFTALALACARIGAVIVPIPPDYKRRELEFILARAEAPVFIGPDSWKGFSYRDLLRELVPVLPSLRSRVFLGATGGLVEGELDFEAHFVASRWEDRYPASVLDTLSARADDVFSVLYTSGTTGEQKGVVHSYNTNYAITRAVIDVMGLGAEDVIALPSILTASNGFTYSMLMSLLLGTTAIQMDEWKPELFLDLVERHGVTFTYGVPGYIMDLLAAQRRRPRNTASLRHLSTGSTPVPPHLIAQVREVFGIQLHTLWGMTENGAVTLTRLEDPPDWPANSDGRPVPWMEVKLVPATGEDGLSLPEGVGRLLVRGASQCLGYFKREDLYTACLDPEGWFDTGDLAREDGRGGIRIVGRLKDVIFRYGENIPVVDIESALYTHPKVHEVAVVPWLDARIGERVCAVVVPRGEPPTLDELREHLHRLGMADHYWPERLELITAMPKTPSGKIRKYLLREHLKGDSVSAA